MNSTKHNPKLSGIGPPRTFDLIRLADVSGISGTGIVAEGCVFSDGTTALRWLTEHRSSVLYESAREVLAIHGHNGATVMRYHALKDTDALACSNCAHPWGGHDLDGACTCSAGGCSCCLMEHPEFQPVGRKEAALQKLEVDRHAFFLNQVHELPRITKSELRKQNKKLREAKKAKRKWCKICLTGPCGLWEFAAKGSDFCRRHK